MIYTITLNPAIDSIIEIDDIKIGSTNYYENKYQTIGGKGINVGIMLRNLDADVKLTGLLGNDNKKVFLNEFYKFNIQHNFIYYPGDTRINFKIKSKSETELNGSGEYFDQEYIDEFLKYLKKILKEGDIVVASGSAPRHVDKNIYQLIGQIVNEAKGMFILDSSKELMEYGLKSKPHLIKPNIQEMCDVLNIKNENITLNQIQDMVQEIQNLGARNILVSLGSEGSMYFSEEGEKYKINTAKGIVKNSVGAGDSMLGGFVYGISKQLTTKECLQYAAACGAATAFTSWIGRKKEVEHLMKEIEVSELN